MADNRPAIVIFGGAGDLSLGMLLPSLYFIHREGRLAPGTRIIAVGRSAFSPPEFLKQVHDGVAARAGRHFEPDSFERFAAALTYVKADATSADALRLLARHIKGASPVLFYLAASPTLYIPICTALKAAGLATADSRLMLEKPLGRDLQSCRAINEAVAAIFDEEQVFRVDHYLGKETVQNLLALRFANAMFEPLWNSGGIDHIQITIAETEGIGERWPYYDEYGALKDMVQNHLLQLVCLVAMEPPSDLDSSAVGEEKAKVLRALRPIRRGDKDAVAVRGQYVGGVVDGRPVPAYAQERGAPSGTETFVALRADIDNWRWSGVPFFLRTGKRMAVRRTEIVIQFKTVPHSIFGGQNLAANRLLIRLQPEEDISLTLMNKEQGHGLGGMDLKAMPLNLTLAHAEFRRRIAYERLLYDALIGNRSLSVDRKEAEHAWAWVDGIADAWRDMPPTTYAAGSWGPKDASSLIQQHGRSWND
jgi:glucose-6-phosphate 1-dehydrogenase